MGVGATTQRASEEQRPQAHCQWLNRVGSAVTHWDIATQIAGGSKQVFGVMVQSHLNAGAQKFTPGKDKTGKLEYGKSITNACLPGLGRLVAVAGSAVASGAGAAHKIRVF
jgi:hypothetical protein